MKWFFEQDENGLEGWFKLALILGASTTAANVLLLIAVLATP